MDDFASWTYSLSYSGCIRVHTMPSELKSILKNGFLLGSNVDNNGDDITPYFNYSNRVINYGVQYIVGIVCSKWCLQKFLSYFNLISKYEAYLRYKLIGPIKYWINCPISGSSQSLIILNLDCVGVLSSFMISGPTYSACLLRTTHVSKQNLT